MQLLMNNEITYQEIVGLIKFRKAQTGQNHKNSDPLPCRAHTNYIDNYSTIIVSKVNAFID